MILCGLCAQAGMAGARKKGPALLIATGRTLQLIGLRDKSKMQFFEYKKGRPSFFSFNHFSRIGSQLFAFQTSPSTGVGTSGIGLFDMTAKKVSILDERGKCPIYVPFSNSIVYFKGRDLMALPLLEAGSKRVIYRLYSYPMWLCPLPISDHEVIFSEKVEDGSVKMVRYDFKSEKTYPYPMPEACKPEMSLGYRERFLCDIGERRYAIWDKEDGLSVLPEDIAKFTKMVPIAYIPELDALLISQPAFSVFGGETSHLWLYYIKRKEKRLLRKNTVANFGVAVYVE